MVTIEKDIKVTFRGESELKKLRTLLWLSLRELAKLQGEVVYHIVENSVYDIEFDINNFTRETNELLDKLKKLQ